MDPLDFWYPWQPALFQMDTLDLTLEQDGFYRRLIDHYMITREPLPNSKGALARIVGCSLDVVEQNYAAVIKQYFFFENELLQHKKCNEILDDQDKRSRKKSKAGKKGAKKRWSQDAENKQENAAAIADPMATAWQLHGTGQDKTGQDNGLSKDRLPEPSKNPDEIQIAFDTYNTIAEKHKLPIAQRLTPKRKSALNARLKECKGIEGWNHAMRLVGESDFLCGRVKNWRADLDFIINPNKFTSIMEGKYKNGYGNTEKQSKEDKELAEFMERQGPEHIG